MNTDKEAQRRFVASQKKCEKYLRKITRAVMVEQFKNWGTTGRMEYIESVLKDLSDSMYNEGEYAR